MGSNSGDLVNQILDTDDAMFAEGLLDDLVVSEAHTVAIDLSVSTLVDQLANGLQVGLSESVLLDFASTSYHELRSIHNKKPTDK